MNFLSVFLSVMSAQYDMMYSFQDGQIELLEKITLVCQSWLGVLCDITRHDLVKFGFDWF